MTTSSSLASSAGGLPSNSSNNNQVLPPELHRIFLEVARTGACSFLPWSTTPSMQGRVDSGTWGERKNDRIVTSYGGVDQYHNSNKKRQHEFKRKYQQQPRNGVGSLLSSSPLDGDDDSIRTGTFDRHNYGRRRYRNRFKRIALDIPPPSSLLGKNGSYDRLNGNSTNSEVSCKVSTSGNLNKSLDECPNALSSSMSKKTSNQCDGIMDPHSHPHHPGGQRLTAAFSDYKNTNSSIDRKRRRPHREVCLSSCSGSISSVGGGSVVSSVRSSSPNSSPLVLGPASSPPIQYGTLQCAIRLAVELVLNHSYMYRDGYKMSTAEERMFDMQRQQQHRQQQHRQLHGAVSTRGISNGKGSCDNATTSNASKDFAAESPTLSPIEAAFIRRKTQLLQMLGDSAFENVLSSPFSPATNSLPQPLPDRTVPKNNQEARVMTKNNKVFTLDTGEEASLSLPSDGTGRVHHFFTTASGDTSDASADSSVRRKDKMKTILPSDTHDTSNIASGPPFTIQRVAEILLEPERYYSQTHKLCNALEKLLLVTSPCSAFGGFTGGNTSQNEREEQEIAAWLNEKGRVETEERQRMRRRDPVLQMNVSVETTQTSKRNPNRNSVSQPLNFTLSNESFNADGSTTSHNDSDHRQLTPNPLVNDSIVMDVATGLHQKFVSVQTDQLHARIYSNPAMDGHSTRNSSDSFSPQSPVTEIVSSKRKQTDLSISKDNISEKVTQALQGQKYSVSSSNITQHLRDNRPLSPIVFHPTVGLLNGHHHQPGLETVTGIDGQSVGMEILIDPAETGSSSQSGGNGGVGESVITDLEQVEQGRLSASNSDADSDTDVSLDDSASDRSDGSDSGPCTGISEPITAARVMALNRMNQQHRREQYLQNRALGQSYSLNYLPPSDVEYQSGDSIDSLMAEDSGGSDSSSSDFAD